MHTRLLTNPRSWWLLAGAAAIVTALLLLPLGSSIGAQEAADDPRVIDPANVCAIPAPEVPFTDRDQIAEVHLNSVDCAFAQEITHGSEDGTTYSPRNAVRRDQMASFIVRTLEAAGGIDIPSPSDQGFADISGNTHEDAINQLAALGITQGRTATSYAPAEEVRRDQMASFIMRAANTLFGTTFEAVGTSPFTDVTDTNVHRQNIDAAFAIFGLTTGQTATTYAPDQSVRRDQMASFLIRLLDVTELTEQSTNTSNVVEDALNLLGAEPSPALTDIIDDVDLDVADTITAPLDTVTEPLDDVADLPLGGQEAPTPDDPASPAPDDPASSADDGESDGGGLLNRLF